MRWSAQQRLEKRAHIEQTYGKPVAEVLHQMHWQDELSILQMSLELGIARSTIVQWLDEAGIPHRNASQATHLQMSRLTPEERRTQTRAFHEKAQQDGWSKHKGRPTGEASPYYKPRVAQPCKWCGQVTMVVPSHAGIRNQYCCPEHRRLWMAENWRGPNNPQYKGTRIKREYVSKRLRRYVVARDEGRCRICGRTARNMEVHHCIPYSVVLVHEPRNLVLLCLSCHHKVHKGKLTSPLPLI